MDNYWALIKTSYIDLKKNKIRTGLTSLGILIGVFSVVLLIAFGQGLKNYIIQEWENLGANIVFVYPGDILGGMNQAGGGMLGNIKFDERDWKTLERVSLAEYVVPVFVKRLRVEAGGKSRLTDLYGTSSDLFKVRSLNILEGRLFTEADVSKKSKIAVIGPKLARELLGSEKAAIGKFLRVGEQKFRVVGVVVEKGGADVGGPDYDSYIYIPHSATTAFNPKDEIFSFYVSAKTENDVMPLKEAAKKALLNRYDDDEFSVFEQTEIMAVFDDILGVMNGVLVALGSISLLVGGIGIMNIMYTSVSERTKEVGVRRALGATKGDILSLFLTEAVILSLLGGFVGLGLAGLIVLVIQPWFPAAISVISMAVALVVSSGIGIFFGIFPALKAANRSPIEAIGYE